MTIPRIIHQTWSDEGIPASLQTLAASWKRHHPDWEYRLWTDAQNREFVRTHHPSLLQRYDSYPRQIQRVDAVRYCLLYTFGGLYVDLDFECFRSFDDLVRDSTCLFGLEPQEHCRIHRRDQIVGNALMATVPEHPLFRALIDDLVAFDPVCADRNTIVLETTGPFMLTRVYERCRATGVTVLPSTCLYPLSVSELERAAQTGWTESDCQKLREAHAVHYFAGTWWRIPAQDGREAVAPARGVET